MGTDPKGPKAEQRPEIKPGDLVLDRYQVVEQIASGGHSVVFLGKDVRLSRPVCIKVFSGLGGKSGVGRTSYEHFVQEAFALSRLTHPNTLRIYDFGHLGSKDVEGMPLQVCEFMNGGTLSNLVREKGKQDIAETARVIGAMCAALSEAHGLGITHRDIKPQNILFGSVGQTKLPKLADFGIAKWSADEPDENRAEDTQIVAGQKLAMYSPSWAAPEQLAGQPVSAATDIYSLAVVAIYMLSGRAIFADEDVYAGYKKRRHADEHVRDALVPLKISKTVIQLLTKALAFDPKKRILNVDELASGLMAALEPRSTGEMAPIHDVETPTVPQDALPPTDKKPRAPTTSDGEPEITVEPTPPPIETPKAAPPGRPGSARPKGPAVLPTERPLVSAEAMESMGFNLEEMGFNQAPTAALTPDASAGAPPPAPTAPPPPSVARTATPMPAAVPGTGNPAHSPLSHSAPPAQSGWRPPVVRPPWMNSAPPPTGQPRWLGPAEYPHLISERRVHFVLTPQHVVDLAGGQGKVRVTLMTSPVGARLVHLKGLTCFVAILGGRPSPAVQLDQPSDIALVTPRAQEIGHIRVAVGTQQADGHRVFPLGTELLAISVEDCSDPILFDFGPGFDAYFVYTRGRPVPVPAPAKPPRRR